MMPHTPRPPEAIAADRARYEDHQRKGLAFTPKSAPTPSPIPAPAPSDILREQVIPGGWYATFALQPGQTLRLQAQGLGSSVSLAAWSAQDPSERLNLPDTVKVQWTTDLRKGRVLFSDMGRVMLSITEDSSGGHDVLTGGSGPLGAGTPMQRNTRDNMVLAALKLGLDRRDLPMLMTFFAPVRVDAAGRFFWNATLLSGADWVELRAEMPLAVALSNTRHPMDPATGQVPPVTATLQAAQAVAADDLCRTATAEAVRGFENNARG
ncbi:MAG: urea amidolyase associated protein UAAP1 [Paracoccaceae bacterium]